jgi:hypothetical protein
MLADILTGIWVLMAAILGWKRQMRYEGMSLLAVVISYILARWLGDLGGAAIGGALKIGDVGGATFLTMALWLILYIGAMKMGKRLMQRETEASNVRIELDEAGNPVVSGGRFGKIGGLVVGGVRGAVLYGAVVAGLVVLIPSFLYKDGRGTAMVQPGSQVMALLQRHEPQLRRLDEAVKGLRALGHLRKNRKAYQAASRQPELDALLKLPQIKALWKEVKLLEKADNQRQGRRHATLLLWMPAFQAAVRDTKTVEALAELSRLSPAPFDRYRDKGAPKGSV